MRDTEALVVQEGGNLTSCLNFSIFSFSALYSSHDHLYSHLVKRSPDAISQWHLWTALNWYWLPLPARHHIPEMALISLSNVFAMMNWIQRLGPQTLAKRL